MPTRNRAKLVRALAASHQHSFELGCKLASQFIESQTDVEYRRLSARFNAKRLLAIVEGPDHPEKANAIASELTGFASFLAMFDDCDDVDYGNRDFLAGFIVGIDREMNSLDNESRAMHRKKLQDIRDLDESFRRSFQKPDSYESLLTDRGRYAGAN